MLKTGHFYFALTVDNGVVDKMIVGGYILRVDVLMTGQIRR